MQSNTDASSTEPESVEHDLGEKSSLSSESKRQREGKRHIGAMGGQTSCSDLVFFEGILPEKDGVVLNNNSTEEQVEQCFDRLEDLLPKRLDLTDLMKFEIQVTAGADNDAIERVYQDRFDEALPPRTTVGVCSLPGDAHVQFDVIAADE